MVHPRVWFRSIWDVAEEHVVLSALHMGLPITHVPHASVVCV